MKTKIALRRENRYLENKCEPSMQWTTRDAKERTKAGTKKKYERILNRDARQTLRERSATFVQ